MGMGRGMHGYRLRNAWVWVEECMGMDRGVHGYG